MSSVARRSREGILPVESTPVRDLECRVQLWGSQCRKDVDLLEPVQRRAQRCPEGWSTSAMETGWESWALQPPEEKAPGRTQSSFQCLRRAGEGLWMRAWNMRTRGNVFKMPEERVSSEIWKKFIPVRVVRPWHRLPREGVPTPSREVFKASLDGSLSNLVQWKLLPWQGLEHDDLSPNPFYDSMTFPIYIKLCFANTFDGDSLSDPNHPLTTAYVHIRSTAQRNSTYYRLKKYLLLQAGRSFYMQNN
ncbi:hypothetical protein DUI87_29261 [Hirundo rustica rustica]|uniref:Uncharacterized protein n=1 Tax=Hirundo rustica rustica TaxID=333673 RepID=A0A3M0J2B2_HIRRU|nr:hypothetical protein DUI87_29261 [Hirundo rustica rustica]